MSIRLRTHSPLCITRSLLRAESWILHALTLYFGIYLAQVGEEPEHVAENGSLNEHNPDSGGILTLRYQEWGDNTDHRPRYGEDHKNNVELQEEREEWDVRTKKCSYKNNVELQEESNGPLGARNAAVCSCAAFHQVNAAISHFSKAEKSNYHPESYRAYKSVFKRPKT